MVWTQELVSVNVREGWSSRLVNSWERLLMVVTDVSMASAAVIFRVTADGSDWRFDGFSGRWNLHEH